MYWVFSLNIRFLTEINLKFQFYGKTFSHKITFLHRFLAFFWFFPTSILFNRFLGNSDIFVRNLLCFVRKSVEKWFVKVYELRWPGVLLTALASDLNSVLWDSCAFTSTGRAETSTPEKQWMMTRTRRRPACSKSLKSIVDYRDGSALKKKINF